MYSTGSKNTLGNKNTFQDNDCTAKKISKPDNETISFLHLQFPFHWMHHEN